MVCASLLLVSLVPEVEAAETTTWSWDAPVDASGPAIVRMQVYFGASNECEIRLTAVASGTGPILRMEFGMGSSVTGNAGAPAQVHNEAIGIDTRTGIGGIGIQGTLSGTWRNTQEVAVINADMSNRLASGADPWYAIGFKLDCQRPFQILGFAGSREVFVFDHATMQGTGASFGALADAAVNVEDRYEATLHSEETEALVVDRTRDGASYKSWSIQTPDGARMEGSGLRTAGVSSTKLSSHAGTWSFTLTQVGVSSWLDFSVWVVGIEPAPGPDAIVP